MAIYYDEWKPYVLGRRAPASGGAAQLAEAARRRARPISPVVIDGRTIAKTFWGKAWCDNLERYSDFANRLPRGRTYVRNGSVVDLQIAPGAVTALVSGSELYRDRGEGGAGPEGALERHLHATARARSIRWSSCCRDGSPSA